jgi:hypothetical protein
MPLKTVGLCPTGHYARKNIGYLWAIRENANYIIETDDDNFPRDEFFGLRNENVRCRAAAGPGWINIYRYFMDSLIWPRGLPLDAIHNAPTVGNTSELMHCPIQQGLADGNPDVDAVYRMVLPLPIEFAVKPAVVISKGVWSPFNSQNTTWWPVAFQLLYLPAHCSFRMTDIWRAMIAQRICWENGWHVLFHSATVYQARNPHDLMKDFAEEVPGFLKNRAIADELVALEIKPGIDRIADNLRKCYELLILMGVVGKAEMALLDAWLDDVVAMGGRG